MVAHIPGKKWKDKHEISEKEKNLSMKMVITALVECGKKKYESYYKPKQNISSDFSRKRQQHLYLCHRGIYF
jgi:flavodoxin